MFVVCWHQQDKCGKRPSDVKRAGGCPASFILPSTAFLSHQCFYFGGISFTAREQWMLLHLRPILHTACRLLHRLPSPKYFFKLKCKWKRDEVKSHCSCFNNPRSNPRWWGLYLKKIAVIRFGLWDLACCHLQECPPGAMSLRNVTQKLGCWHM